jgi:hypothetical protein
VGGAPRIDTLAADITGALGKLAGTGYEIAADVEARESKRLADALAAKQAIVDEVEATRRAGDFEEAAVGLSDSLQQKHWSDPQNAIPEYIAEARRQADEQIRTAPNAEVGLQLARATASRISAGTRDLHSWVSARQTQKAKADLTAMTNHVTRGAESVGTPDALASYLADKETSLAPVFQKVYGGEADARMAALKRDATRAFVSVGGERDPLGMLNALDARSGPLVDHLSSSDREALRKETKASFDGYGKAREMETLKKNVGHNRDVFDAFQAGSLDAGTMYSLQRTLAEEQKAIKVDKRLSPEQKAAQGTLLAERAAFLDAMEKARRRQTQFDAEDAPGTVAELIQQQHALFKAENGVKGNDLSEWSKQQTRLMEAFGDKKISQSTYNTMFKELALALPDAATAEGKKTGWDFYVYQWRTPREAGVAEMNRLVAGEFRAMTPEQRTAAQVRFVQLYNDAHTVGASVTEKQATTMARKALSLETGRVIPGAFD